MLYIEYLSWQVHNTHSVSLSKYGTFLKKVSAVDRNIDTILGMLQIAQP